jgi:uncharacterized membrane protein YidH (DUF202 family)
VTVDDGAGEGPLDDPDLPGLAGERTDLAWSRSALALVVAGAALLRRIWEDVDVANAQALVFSVLGVGAVSWVTALVWAHGAARSTMEGRRIADAAALRRMTAGTLLFCVAALILAVLPGGG